MLRPYDWRRGCVVWKWKKICFFALWIFFDFLVEIFNSTVAGSIGDLVGVDEECDNGDVTILFFWIFDLNFELLDNPTQSAKVQVSAIAI